MNIDEAKAAWTVHGGDSPAYSGLVDKIRRTERFELTILRRDVIESIAALGVAAFFGSSLPERTSWMEWLGTLIVVLGAIEIAIVLNVVRIRGGRAPVDASMRDYCFHELTRTQRQITLLKNVKWWYLGPIAAGLIMIQLGSSDPWALKLLSIGLILAIFRWIHKLNQSAVRDSLLPLRNSLQETLASLDQES